MRFALLSLDTIERTAKTPGCSIEIANRKRSVRIACTVGKHQDKEQAVLDRHGEHAPFDQIGGVICSDLKNPMTLAGIDSEIATSSTSSTIN